MNKIALPSSVLPASADEARRTMRGTSTSSSEAPAPKVWTLCTVCGIEVPLDEALVPEATDQLTYLCGLDCYARWRADAATYFPSLSPKPD